MSYFPIMSIEQANPGLWRARQLAELDRQNREAMFAPFTLAQELKKMQQYNQYYPEDIQSQIGARNANTSLHQAMADWFGPTAQSHIDLINQAQIPTALANNAYTGAQTRGLNTENILKSRLAQLYGIEMPTQYADQNNYTAPENNNYSMPDIDVSSFNKNPTTYTGGVPLSAPQYEKMYQQYAQNATTPEAVAFHDLNPPNPAQYNALLNQPKNSPQQQPVLSNAYEQAQQANNLPIQEQNPGSVSEYMRNIGITPPQTNMSMAPQGQEYTPSPQNLSMLNAGMPIQRAAQQAQMPAQMPTPEQMRQREIANINQLLGKKVSGNAPINAQEKLDNAVDLAAKKIDLKAYETTDKQASASSDSALEAIAQLDILKNASGRLKSAERGPFAGRAPAMSEAAQVYDKTSAALQKAVMDSMKGQGQMSKAKMEFIEKIKPNRHMGKAASEKIGDTLGAMAERSLEKQPFFTLAQQYGFTHKEAQSIWTLYNRERPEYDAKRQAPINGNLNQYNEYLNRNALDAALKGKPYNPIGAQNKNIELKEVKGAENNKGASYDEEKIAHTAKKYNMSIEEVKRKLGII